MQINRFGGRRCHCPLTTRRSFSSHVDVEAKFKNKRKNKKIAVCAVTTAV